MSDEDDPESIATVLQAVADDPHHVFTYEKAASIRIGLTRDLLRELAFKPTRAAAASWCCATPTACARTSTRRCSRCSRSPGASTLWVLTTSRPNRLPPTIRSRCLRVRFTLLPEETIEAYLRERAGVGAAPARLLAALAAGSLSRALTMRGENVAGLRDDALKQLGAPNSGDASRILAAANDAAAWSNREKMRGTLEFQFLLLRDLLRLRHGAPEDTLVNRDRIADLKRVAPAVDVKEIRRRTALLEEVVRAIDSNVTPEAAFFSAYARWAKHLPQDVAARTEAWPAWNRARVES